MWEDNDGGPEEVGPAEDQVVEAGIEEVVVVRGVRGCEVGEAMRGEAKSYVFFVLMGASATSRGG